MRLPHAANTRPHANISRHQFITPPSHVTNSSRQHLTSPIHRSISLCHRSDGASSSAAAVDPSDVTTEESSVMFSREGGEGHRSRVPPVMAAAASSSASSSCGKLLVSAERLSASADDGSEDVTAAAVRTTGRLAVITSMAQKEELLCARAFSVRPARLSTGTTRRRGAGFG